MTHNQDLRYRFAGNTAVSKSEENPSKYSHKTELLCDHSATSQQVGCEFHELYPTSRQSKVTPAAPCPAVGATEATFPFGTARKDLKQLQTGFRVCTVALLFCFGQREKKKKKNPNKSKPN